MGECPLDVYEFQLHPFPPLPPLEPNSLRRGHAQQCLECLQWRRRRKHIIPGIPLDLLGN
eukprot:15435955-Alexandrium_andersonii.AAC.1